MKTFTEIKFATLKQESQKIAKAEALLKSPTSDDWDKASAQKQIKTSVFIIDNIDEIVSIYIARNANILIEELKQASQCVSFHPSFQTNLSDFLYKTANLYTDENDHLTPDKTAILIHNSDIQRIVMYFGFTLADLEFLQEQTIDNQIRDQFIQIINAHYGTRIPSTTELAEAEIKVETTQPLKIEWHEAIKEKNLTKLRNGEFIGRGVPTMLEKDILAAFNQTMSEHYRNVCDKLPEEERLTIIAALEHKDCSTCQTENCETKRLGEATHCQSWYNAELIGKSKVLKKTDIHELMSPTTM